LLFFRLHVQSCRCADCTAHAARRCKAHLHARMLLAHVSVRFSECMCSLAGLLAALRMLRAGVKRTYERLCFLRMCFVVLRSACAVLQVC
jgi:hypothetical protein